MMPSLDILMVTYRSAAFERVALRSLRRGTDVSHGLTIVNNTRANRPLTSIWNAWARRSQAPHVCFVNPDVVFGRAWASRLLGAMSLPRVVIATPSTPSGAASPLQRMPDPLAGRLAAAWRRQSIAGGAGAALVRTATAGALEWRVDRLARSRRVEVVDDPYCVAFCYCVDREWLHSVGYFDEAAFPFYGQETDLSFRAVAAGRRAVCVRGAVVYHHGGGSGAVESPRDRTRELDECFQRLKARWPSWEHQV
jgi:GT2 family glycosyltransferase